jgi:hypothetical protein
MPEKEASMEPKPVSEYQYHWDSAVIWANLSPDEQWRCNGHYVSREEAEARLAAAEQQAQTLRTALSYAVEALDTDRWKSILGTDWMAEAKAALNLQSAGASDES